MGCRVAAAVMVMIAIVDLLSYLALALVTSVVTLGQKLLARYGKHVRQGGDPDRTGRSNSSAATTLTQPLCLALQLVFER